MDFERMHGRFSNSRRDGIHSHAIFGMFHRQGFRGGVQRALVRDLRTSGTLFIGRSTKLEVTDHDRARSGSSDPVRVGSYERSL
jgi:hypothetical protein